VKLWCLPILAGLCVLAGCQDTDPLGPKYAEEAVSWGTPVNGLRVGLARRVYEAGKAPDFDRRYFTLLLRSARGTEVRVLSPAATSGTIPQKLAGDESVAARLNYVVDGKVRTMSFTPPTRPAVQVLDRDHDYRLELRLSAGDFGVDRFAAGTMTVTYVNAQSSIRYSDDGDVTRGLWTGEAVSGPVTVEVETPAATAPVGRQGGGDAR
jgi:hypothetical protein